MRVLRAMASSRGEGAAVEAAALLGRVERHDTLAAAAQLFTAAGNAARQAGRWSQSQAAHRQAYALARAEFGADSEQAAAAGHNLAVTLKYTGGFTEADRLYRAALDVATATGNDAFAAVICHNLGGLAHARRTPAEGVPWARQGLRLREKCDPNPLAVAADQGALAALLISAGEYDEAEHLLTRCRAAFVELLGPDHYEVAVVDGNLAALALARDNLDAAQTHAQHALAGKHATLGPTHPYLAPTLTTLGTIRRRLGSHADAIALHQRAFDVLAPQVTPDHPLLATIRANLQIATDCRPR